MTYDARSRLLTRSVPAFGSESTRTITYSYAVSGNPLTTSVTDSAGTITTTVDLLGRPVSSTDVWAKTTTTAYDQAGRATTQVWNATITTESIYNSSGQLASVKLDGLTVATVAYDATTGGPPATPIRTAPATVVTARAPRRSPTTVSAAKPASSGSTLPRHRPRSRRTPTP